mmetsp:Transcript_20649/g.47369  ORF Transcript_20649/g.47369 Transcript_20649/m.47369 type:complete len:98 (+) Transcript_20649:11-304(+)|eukprot:1964012-Amphidinium_carterae.1
MSRSISARSLDASKTGARANVKLALEHERKNDEERMLAEVYNQLNKEQHLIADVHRSLFRGLWDVHEEEKEETGEEPFAESHSHVLKVPLTGVSRLL